MSDKEFNYKDAKQFLQLLDPDSKKFTFQAFHSDRKVNPTAPMHGTLKKWWDSLCNYNMDGFGIYVTINKTDLKGRKINNIVGIRAIWQEDDGEGKKLPFKPHLVVSTSPGKYHRYLFTKPVSTSIVSKEEFDAAQIKIVKKYGSDKNSRDITRVLRVPGFFNVKPNLKEPHLVKIEKCSDDIKRPSWKKIKKTLKLKELTNGDARKSYDREKSFSFSEAIEEISDAHSYYEPMLSWSMYLANRNVPEDGIVTILQMALEMGKKKRPEQDMDIWLERYEGVQQMAQTAIRKVRSETTYNSVDENDFMSAMVEGNKLLNEKIKKVKYWIKPIITDASINMIHATRGLGKTFFSLSLGVAIGAGRTFMKWQSVRCSKVLYIDGELPYARLKEQYSISCSTIGVKKSEVTLMTGDKFANKVFPDLTIKDNQEELQKIILKEGYKVVIFDNIATVFKTSEERQKDWKGIQDWLITLRTRGVSTILIHHDNKAGDAQRGYSNKEDVMDTVIHLKKPINQKDTDGAKFNVTFSKGRYLSGGDGKNFGAELRKFDDGMFIWIHGDIHGSKYELTIEHFKDGMTAFEISRVLAISTSMVSKYKVKALREGDLKEDEVRSGPKGGKFDKKRKPMGRKKVKKNDKK